MILFRLTAQLASEFRKDGDEDIENTKLCIYSRSIYELARRTYLYFSLGASLLLSNDEEEDSNLGLLPPEESSTMT